MKTTDIDIFAFSPAKAENIPKYHCLLGLDRQSGESFGNATFMGAEAMVCASYDGVPMVQAGKKGVLFPLKWLQAEFPKARKIWEAQARTLRTYATENNLPFSEPFGE